MHSSPACRAVLTGRVPCSRPRGGALGIVPGQPDGFGGTAWKFPAAPSPLHTHATATGRPASVIRWRSMPRQRRPTPPCAGTTRRRTSAQPSVRNAGERGCGASRISRYVASMTQRRIDDDRCAPNPGVHSCRCPVRCWPRMALIPCQRMEKSGRAGLILEGCVSALTVTSVINEFQPGREQCEYWSQVPLAL